MKSRRFPPHRHTLARLIVFLLMASSIALSPIRGTGAAQATSSSATIGDPSRIGIVADVGTRYGHYGRQSEPVAVLAGSGAKWVKEEFRWDWVQPSRDRWEWAFMDEAVDEEKARGLEI